MLPPETPQAGAFLNTQSPESSVDDALSPRAVIEADSDDQNSVLSTRSVRESIYEYIRENGRTYHRFSEGSTYYLPNDEMEHERLNLQFYVLKNLFGNRNYFAPIGSPCRILDIGTGTGRWVLEMAEEFPNAQLTGTDLSLSFEENPFDNVRFLIEDNSQDDWGSKTYDYIHTRVLLGSFKDFRALINRSFRYLEPGGWMESQELYPTVYCDDGTMPEDHPFLEWSRNLDEAAMSCRVPIRTGNKMKRWYEQAGFVDVHEEVMKMPINPWPKDPQYKLLGRFWEQSLLDGLQAFSLRYFSTAFGWTKEEIEVYLVRVRQALSDRRVHAYHRIYVVWGRKPTEAEARERAQRAANTSGIPPIGSAR